ncbi:MAG: DUF3488 and transglutaminase-like domain-containing protein [Chloroflexota bacterium]|nr:DUF3488 and transglutaminase-like domain-containing protein [Chloroflexota bacterium]
MRAAISRLGPTRFRVVDVLVLAAATLVVLQAPLSVVEAAWVPDLDTLPRLAVAGLLVGYLVERTRLPGAVGLPLGAVLGAEIVTYVFAWPAGSGTLAERVGLLGGRVGAWLDTIASGGVSNDPLVFAVAMAALAWLLGLVTAWLLFRDQVPWLGIVFNGVALLMNLSYASPSLIGYVGVFIFAACLLLATHQLARRTELWRRAQLRVGWRIVANVLTGTAVAVGAMLLLAAALPANAFSPGVAAGWGRVTSPWQSMEGEFDRWFAALSGSGRNARGLTFGRTLAPRGAFDLGDTPVLQVRSSAPLYLRATTADRYAGQAITSSETVSGDVEANTNLLPDERIPDRRVMVQADIKVLASRTSVALAPDAPLRFNVPVQVETRGNADDVAAVRLVAPAQQNQQYSVVAAMSTASIQELNAAGEDYPEWIRQHYLQVPRRLPRRVVDLAHQIGQGRVSAFQRAEAIEQYLRETYAYSTHVASVPPDRDWVDYFLFDARQGYCDYFATAMVVLLRVDGIPARVASGFAPGDFDESSGISMVRENHAHSWVEAYFPRYGWVTFEPSAIRPVPTRIQEPPQATSPPPPEPATHADASRLSREELDELLEGGNTGSATSTPRTPLLARIALLVLAAVAAALVVGGLIAAALAVAWRRGMGSLARYQQPYVQLLRLGRWSGSLRPQPSHTAFEVAEQLSRQVPAARPAIHDLTTAYVEGTYADRQPERDPWPSWLQARREVIRGLLRRRLGRWLGYEAPAQPASRSRPELLRRWGASRSTPRLPRPGAKPRLER